MTAPLAAPPYALQSVELAYPGLAALAARASVGGQREAALACITVIRLALATVQPVELSFELRRERAEAARAWLSTLPVEAAHRPLFTRAINATASATRSELAAEIGLIADALESALDKASLADLASASQRLRG